MPSTSDRAPDPRPARTKAAIFAAARDLTTLDGEVTVNALAKRAGVSRAAFYSHFSGLDDLLGAMLREMYEATWNRAPEYRSRGMTLHEGIFSGFGLLVANVERHHAFLRGALDWKFSHRTYMILVDAMTSAHRVALDYLGEDVPPALRNEATCRYIAGGVLALLVQWLAETDQQSRDGEQVDATELLEQVLRNTPSWYTGLAFDDPISAHEIMAEGRAALDAADASGADPDGS